MTKLIAILLLAIGMVSAVQAEPVNARDIQVIDGDTVDHQNQRYRLIGFDTPESKNVPWRKVSEEERAMGAIARDRLIELLQTGTIDLTEKPCACSASKIASGKCNHGRKCAVLSRNGMNVGDTLIDEELAVQFICSETKCPKMRDWTQMISGEE